jgi:hypothetical protein
MFIRLKNQEIFLKSLIKKEGSYRKLAEKLEIPSPSFFPYLYGRRIPEDRAKKIVDFSGEVYEKMIEETFETNFRQKLGGKNCVISKKKKGTFERDMKNIQKIQSKKLKEWHRDMKDNNPEKYYKIQYSRFKKISGYKFKTKNGEKVRNLFEKKVADILFDYGVSYKYEPLVHVGKKYFFPDFLIGKDLIIECTAWKGESKAYKLKEKISYLKNKYKVYVAIPESLRKYYKIIEDYLLVGPNEIIQALNLQMNKV